MEERRTLTFIKEEDIPSRAVSWDGTTSPSPSGNVFYIPLYETNTRSFKTYWNGSGSEVTVTMRFPASTLTSNNNVVYKGISGKMGWSTTSTNFFGGIKGSKNVDILYINDAPFFIGASRTGGYELLSLIYPTIPYKGQVNEYLYMLSSTPYYPNSYIKLYSDTVHSLSIGLALANIGNFYYGGTGSSKYQSYSIHDTVGWQHPIYIDTES